MHFCRAKIPFYTIISLFLFATHSTFCMDQNKAPNVGDHIDTSIFADIVARANRTRVSEIMETIIGRMFTLNLFLDEFEAGQHALSKDNLTYLKKSYAILESLTANFSHATEHKRNAGLDFFYDRINTTKKRAHRAALVIVINSILHVEQPSLSHADLLRNRSEELAQLIPSQVVGSAHYHSYIRSLSRTSFVLALRIRKNHNPLELFLHDLRRLHEFEPQSSTQEEHSMAINELTRLNSLFIAKIQNDDAIDNKSKSTMRAQLVALHDKFTKK